LDRDRNNSVDGSSGGDQRSGVDRRSGGDRRSELNTLGEEETFLYKNQRFSSLLGDADNISASKEDAAADFKASTTSSNKSCDHNLRSGPDRRSGLDTRSPEEKFLQGERRSSQDRRSKTEHRYRSFKKARTFARGLGFKSAHDWREYSKLGMRPDDIPVAPHRIYANDGWVGWNDWLAASSGAAYLYRNRSFKSIRTFVRSLGLIFVGKWKTYCKPGKKPDDIPARPDRTYENEDCAGVRGDTAQLLGGTVADGGDTSCGRIKTGAMRKKAAPKYRGPDGKTWTGRGRKPRWLTSAMEEGKTPEDFLIVAHDKGAPQ
jgi:H-NS histone C-terminal domain